MLISTHYMDEAVRCHRLAYIAGGGLLTWGKVAEVIARESLTTWSVSGENLFDAAAFLRDKPGVGQATFFGDVLRVSGRDSQELARTMESLMATGFTCRQVETGLEEVFISLMNRMGKTSA